MINVIRFNPLDEKQFTFDIIQTNWKVIDEFYFQTSVGPILQGLVWKDTPLNRAIIEQIIRDKKRLFAYSNEISSRIHTALNNKEK